ncbi:MAG: Ubiquinone biosynthesis protein [Chaenotheca gracillima]|nr:MAG: Ubiquinone biosynthesis protein [Chaenotheca gracillima]
MEPGNVSGLLEQLEENIGDLEETLSPLIKPALSETASKLPLLDKAKLYVLATYSLESLLFSHLRLNNIDAKSHPVFRELTRVRQYFEKIKAAEDPVQTRPTMSLDKEAAGRFIKHAITHRKRNFPDSERGNPEFTGETVEQAEAREAARAEIKKLKANDWKEKQKMKQLKRLEAKRQRATEEKTVAQDSLEGEDSMETSAVTSNAATPKSTDVQSGDGAPQLATSEPGEGSKKKEKRKKPSDNEGSGAGQSKKPKRKGRKKS